MNKQKIEITLWPRPGFMDIQSNPYFLDLCDSRCSESDITHLILNHSIKKSEHSNKTNDL